MKLRIGDSFILITVCFFNPLYNIHNQYLTNANHKKFANSKNNSYICPDSRRYGHLGD